MEVVRLMGKEVREYTDKSTGEVKTFCGLHVVYEKTEDDRISGKKCESITCPQKVNYNDLKLGQTYELKHAFFNTKNGMGARVSGLVPVDLK